MTTGFITELQKGEKEATFTGKVGNESFTNAVIYDQNGNQLKSTDEISLDTLVTYDATPIQKLNVKVLVVTRGKIDRQSTYSHVQNLVNAIEKEPEKGIIVDIKK